MGMPAPLRLAFLIAVALMPKPLKFFIYRRFFRWTIHPTAAIGMSIITAGQVSLGNSATIGHFNVVRNVPVLVLEDHAAIGQWNWITCATFFTSGQASIPPPASQGLFMGIHSALTSRHYVDCAAEVRIGAYTVVGGVRSTIMTHYIDVATNTALCKTVYIGDYCYIASNVKIVPGTSIPDACVIGMGAVVAGNLAESHTVYVGVPAKPVRRVRNGEYFTRTTGRSR